MHFAFVNPYIPRGRLSLLQFSNRLYPFRLRFIPTMSAIPGRHLDPKLHVESDNQHPVQQIQTQRVKRATDHRSLR